jgi:Protein of unknown function (DUF3796)
MSRTTMLWLLDRVPRYASLLGLLGLIGFAGVFDPALYRWSALSFLSYLAFFRFFRRFINPTYVPTARSGIVLLAAFLVAVLSPWLLAITPLFGLVGFAGWSALYDPTPTAPRTPPA